MKKFFSLVLFVLTLLIFALDMSFGIEVSIDVNNQLAELAARGASGHELLGVPLDFLVISVVGISVVGGVISLVSWKIAQYGAIRILSGVMCSMFLMPMIVSFIILKF